MLGAGEGFAQGRIGFVERGRGILDRIDVLRVKIGVNVPAPGQVIPFVFGRSNGKTPRLAEAFKMIGGSIVDDVAATLNPLGVLLRRAGSSTPAGRAPC